MMYPHLMPKRPIVRSEVRAIAEIRQKILAEVLEKGGNQHQVILDISDEIDAHIASWTDEEKIDFYNMLTQETNAITDDLIHKARMMNVAAAEKDAEDIKSALAWEWFIAIIFSVIILFIVFGR